MAKQIKNRREDLYINEVPPEILDETTLSADGFVKNTDYASSTTAGVIKIAPSSGTTITSGGTIQGSVRTVEQYVSAATSLIISKGTLENVLVEILAQTLATYLGDAYTEAETGAQFKLMLRKAEGGPMIDTF